MRQNGVLTDGRAADSTVASSAELRVIESPGAINRFVKASIATILGAPTVVTLTADTSITAATHRGRTLLLGEVGGNAQLTATLPAATGSGSVYKFVVSVVNTSNYIIKAISDDVFYGNIITNSTGDTPDLGQPWTANGDFDEIVLNGTTQGGARIGDWLEVQDILTGKWAVRGVTTTSGTEATPFSASPSSSISGTASASASSSPTTSPSASVSSSPSSSISGSPSSSVSGSVSSSPSTSVSGSPTTSISSSPSSSPSTSVSGSPTTSISSSPSSSVSASVSSSTSPSSSPS